MNSWFEAGHVAIVTGASRGLGKALARELLARGIITIINGRDPVTLATARDELGQVGNVIAIAGDVSDEAHAHALIAGARDLGRLDLLVNNASTLGHVPLPPVDRIAADTLNRLFDVNVFAPIHLIRHALPLMRAGAGGTIVNITSDAAVESYPTWGGYGATKAALEHVSRTLAAELEGTPVRILVADPGDMNTQMHRDAVPGADLAALRDPADSARALVRAIATMQSPFERVRLTETVPA